MSHQTGSVFVVGATGATGRLLVAQLLARGYAVRTVVRSSKSLPEAVLCHPQFSAVEANLLELSEQELGAQVEGCAAVVSCLGHNLTFKGLFGPPRRLVADATRRLCAAIRARSDAAPGKFILMNTTGCRNPDLGEKVSLAQSCVIGLLRLLLPPHADNEAALHYLRTQVGPDDPRIEWAAVRPDGLIDEDAVSPYDLHPSPTRSAIFDAGKTSRINVAHFMAELIANPGVWMMWRHRTPVIYNRMP